jgi:hypothetical protein
MDHLFAKLSNDAYVADSQYKGWHKQPILGILRNFLIFLISLFRIHTLANIIESIMSSLRLSIMRVIWIYSSELSFMGKWGYNSAMKESLNKNIE